MKKITFRIGIGIVCILAIYIMIVSFFNESFISIRSGIVAIFCAVAGIGLLVVDVRDVWQKK